MLHNRSLRDSKFEISTAPRDSRRPVRRLARLLIVSTAAAGALIGAFHAERDGETGQFLYRPSQPPPGAGARPVEVVAEGIDYRIVRHVAGVTRVPAKPQRICALACADECLALGIKPVAHSIADGNFPDYLAEAFADVPWIPNVYGGNLPNMEAVIDVHPDLIITRSPSRQTYAQLSKIAPVVMLMDHLVYYRQRVLDVGTIVGRRAEAEACVAWYNAKVAAARDVLDQHLGDDSMAILRVRPNSYRLMGDQHHDSPLLYGDLAIRRPWLVDHRNWGATMSPEGLLHLDADYLIVSADAVAGGRRTLDTLFGHPIWRRVPAVRNDQVLVISKYRHWADAGILGRARGIDDVIRAVAPEQVEHVRARAAAAVDIGHLRDGT